MISKKTSRPDPLHYPHSETPAWGDATEVAQGIWWIRHALPFALNHINVWALAPAPDQPEDGWTLVDTGIGNADTQAHWQALLANVIRGRIGRIVVTHYHPDHVGLAHWLMHQHDVPLYMSLTEHLACHALYHHQPPYTLDDEILHMKRHGLIPMQEASLGTRQDYYRQHVLGVPEAINRLIPGEHLHLGGREWQLIVGRGHSPEHISLYCAEANVCIAGDMLLPRISTNVRVSGDMPLANPVKWFTHSLQVMREILPSETLILPSHGLPFVGAHLRIDALLKHHEKRMQQVLDIYAASQKPRVQAVDLLSGLFPFPLDGHSLFFAIGEAIAHLNELVDAGKMVRETEGEAVYFRANI